MSISATSGYMSNDEIVAWMQDKTSSMYGNLSGAMATADERTNAESDLNDIKAALVNNKGKEVGNTLNMIKDALTKYGDIPEVVKLLTPMRDELQGNLDANQGTLTFNDDGTATYSGYSPTMITDHESDDWSKQIGDSVDALGKQDQLSMINIQEFNSEINQVKQTASALLDSAEKTSSAIINHIS